MLLEQPIFNQIKHTEYNQKENRNRVNVGSVNDFNEIKKTPMHCKHKKMLFY